MVCACAATLLRYDNWGVIRSLKWSETDWRLVSLRLNCQTLVRVGSLVMSGKGGMNETALKPGVV